MMGKVGEIAKAAAELGHKFRGKGPSHKGYTREKDAPERQASRGCAAPGAGRAQELQPPAACRRAALRRYLPPASPTRAPLMWLPFRRRRQTRSKPRSPRRSGAAPW